MSVEEKIERLEEFKLRLNQYRTAYDPKHREWINQNMHWARREVIEARCFKTFTISPPPAVGGLVMQNMDLFSNVFDPPYGFSVVSRICDMIDNTIGVLRNPLPAKNAAAVVVESPIQEGYAFIAMPIDPDDHQLVDVLESIKDAAARCGITVERVDEVESNERITDRILESISKAEFVIVDLTKERPNVFFEAGYAHGLQKTPIYIARHGTTIHFDIKDYPIITFRNMKELKDRITNRLVTLTRMRKERGAVKE